MNSTVISNNSLQETISQAEALKLAKHVSGQNAQLIRYQLQSCKNKVDNHHSSYLQLLLEIKSGESFGVEHHSLLVKTLPNVSSSSNGEDIFQHEFTFYRDIVPQLLKHVDLGRWISKCFLVRNGILVLEDPTIKGFSTRECIFDEETTKSALRSVARLHASSILAEARLEQSLYELYPNAFKEVNTMDNGKDQDWFSTAKNTAIVVADSLGLNSSKISQVFDRFQQIVIEESKSSTDQQRKYKVATHGNLWASNMLFDSNQQPNCILINFKSIRYASPAQDILLLLHLCTTREFRQKFELKMIEFYHSTLRTFSYKYNPAARVIPFDQLKHELEEQRLRAIISATAYLPIILLDKKFASDVLDDSIKYDKFRCCGRGQKVIELMQKDEMYRKRIEESVRELVDYSEQYF